MESSNLNNRLPEDDDLDVQFRTHFSAPPLADNGFSQRVLAALPSAKRQSLQWQRRFVCVAGLAAGIAAAAMGIPRSGNFESALISLDSTLTLGLGQLFTVPVGLALGLALLSMHFAFRGQWRLLPRL